MLSRSRSPHDPFRLTLFPELCLPGQALMLCRDIATSIGDPDNFHNIDMLGIYVVDFSSSKYAIICEVIEAMAQYFADCMALSMKVQTGVVQGTVLNPWMIPGFSAAIGRFKLLKRLNFYMRRDFSDNDSLHQAGNVLHSFVFKELIFACPTLTEVYVGN
ncbi:hypothetical protein JOM56_010353 [Amanita muscaria]